MSHANTPREREVEHRLGRIESPEPPADLLDRIRGDIADHLPGDEPAPRAAGRMRRYRLIAASLAIAAAGGLLAYRVLREAPDERFFHELDGTEPVAAPTADEPRAASKAGSEAPLGASEHQATADREAAPSQPPHQEPGSPAGAVAPVPSTAAGRDDRASEGFAERMSAAPSPATPPPPPSAVAPSEERELQARTRAYPSIAEVPRPMVRDEIQVESTSPAVSERKVPQGAAYSPGETTTRRPVVPPGRRSPAGDATAAPSTGGSAEPNDQPWGDMFFRPYGTNPFVDTEDDPQSTFGLDVDTGSYTLARGYLERGQLPPAEAIRVEEFLNYFDYGDSPPRRGDFAITAEGAPSPWMRGPRYQLLRIGLRGRDVAPADRRDATLVFVVDVSGSMKREDRLGLVKRALHLLLDQLGSGDQVGLVVYGSRGQVLLEPSNDLGAARRAIDRLAPGGSTNAEEGLVLAYELARRHYRPESINRLVLCSDGVANVGRTGPESILERVGREAEDGIELTTVGFGMGNYNDVLMEQLADRGDGNYAYVDTLDEARRVFVENLTGTLQTIAGDAKIQVEFDPRVVSRYRLLGYENRDVADHRFRDDTVDAGEIGAGHRVTALYEIKLAEDAPRRRRLAEVRLRHRSQAAGRVVEESLSVAPSQLAPSWDAAPPSLKLAALAAELAEVLKRSYWTRETRPEDLRRRAREVAGAFQGDDEVAELARLAERAAGLVDWQPAPPE